MIQTTIICLGRYLLNLPPLYISSWVSLLVNPSGIVSGLGYENLTKNALTDVMASYGGLWIGIGALIFSFNNSGQHYNALLVDKAYFYGFCFRKAHGSLKV